ncbi:hypothetical protein ACIA48_19600 [Mycobacterium sp. NPDC051804]|uniref:hypothetical protein n=1 Tax=Mycobacterium sp. NPDC051804 TaxID=3364295 RepID=UPI0037B43FF9
MKLSITSLVGSGAVAVAVLLGGASQAAIVHAEPAKPTVTKPPPPPVWTSGIDGESKDDKHSDPFY